MTTQVMWPIADDRTRVEIVTLKFDRLQCATCRATWWVRADVHPRQMVCACKGGA